VTGRAVTGRVLVAGDVIHDIIVRPEGPLRRGTDTRAAIRMMPGGSAANHAAWLAALGVPVRFAGRCGIDERDAISAAMQRRGIEPVLAADPVAATGALIAIIDPDGERSFLTDRGANLNLAGADLPASLLTGISHVSLSGYSFFAPGPRAAIMGLLAAARSHDIPVSVDASSTGFLEEAGPANFLDWTAGATLLFANEDEAALLSGEGDISAQIEALGRNYDRVVIKRGARGAVVGGAGGISHSREAEPAIVVDSTGAGDAFAAGYVAGLLRDGSDEALALASGVSAGARAIAVAGGQPPEFA
jgi:sugar/nucleoside kinase (ribokinase family)